MNTIVYSTTSFSAKGLYGFYLSHYLLGKVGFLKNYIDQAVSLINKEGSVIFCFIGSEFGKTAESIFPTKRYYFSSCLRENETSAEKYTMQGRKGDYGIINLKIYLKKTALVKTKLPYVEVHVSGLKDGNNIIPLINILRANK